MLRGSGLLNSHLVRRSEGNKTMDLKHPQEQQDRKNYSVQKTWINSSNDLKTNYYQSKTLNHSIDILPQQSDVQFGMISRKVYQENNENLPSDTFIISCPTQGVKVNSKDMEDFGQKSILVNNLHFQMTENSSISTQEEKELSRESYNEKKKFGCDDNLGFEVTPKRWIILTLFSLGAFLNNVICFSYSPLTSIAQK